MKRTAILTIFFAGFIIAACKKERVCECASTTTVSNDSATTVTSDPAKLIEIREIKGGEAKSWCQKSTIEIISGKTTTTTINDCKLK